jgi:uncharacterized protein with PIN domain
MSHQVMAAWECRACDVQGRSHDTEPRCWNCDGPVVVTARPTVRNEVVRRVIVHG